MVKKVMNLNPKRLVTFQRRFLNLLKTELQEAHKRGETDYVFWLNIKFVKSKRMLNKKITKVKKT